MCYSWFQLPKVTLNEQLSSVLSGDIPESILLINTAEWQGQVRTFRCNSQNDKCMCVFDAKTDETFSVRPMSFPELAIISFTFNSAFRSSNIWFSYSVFWSISFSLSPSRIIWTQFENWTKGPQLLAVDEATRPNMTISWPFRVCVFRKSSCSTHHFTPLSPCFQFSFRPGDSFWVTKDSVLASTVGGIE